MGLSKKIINNRESSEAGYLQKAYCLLSKCNVFDLLVIFICAADQTQYHGGQVNGGGGVDIGSFIVRADVAHAIKFNHAVTEYDWGFISDVKNHYQNSIECIYISRALYVCN
jgi:hypothetical protein